jgi:hypothetical protein
MHFDRKRGLYLPGPPPADDHAETRAETPESEEGPESEARRSRESAVRKVVLGTVGGAICAVVTAGLVVLSGHLPAPYLAILPGLPVLFLGPLVDLLDVRKEIFPNRALPWRRVLVTAGYTAFLVVALNVEGAVLTGITGSESGLLILNLLTAIAMGVLIGRRSPTLAGLTIVEVSFAGSVLGVLVDLSFLGWSGFQQVHVGAPVFVVMIETGTLFTVAGLIGYVGLRALRRNAAAPADQAEGRRLIRADRPRERLMIAAAAIGLFFLVGIATYAVGYARAANAVPASAIYPVQGRIAKAGRVVLSLTGLQVRPDGSVVVALTYRNVGSKAVGLSCVGYSNPAAATIQFADGRTESSTATFCSVHQGSVRRIGAGKSIISYAEFPDGRGLDRPFTLSWHAGSFSGSLPGLSLTSRSLGSAP